MKTGTESISDNVVYNFYDSGGPYVLDPSLDPTNDYNWVSWYQHNESYLLHLTNPLAGSGKGIMVTFNYVLINNDHLKIYEGDLEDEASLIADLTCNDYSTNNYAGFNVISHGNMTIRFESDFRWRDAGWEALVKLFDYAPQPPVANMQACASYVELLSGGMAPSIEGASGETKIYYTTDGNTPDPNDVDDPLSSTKLYTGPFEITVAPTTVKAILVENGTATSSVASYTFNRLITPPAAPTITHVPNTNTVIITAPAVPSGINDTYYVRYSIDGTDPRYSSLESVGSATIELTQPCTVRAVTRGTTCPDIFSEAEDTETISTIYMPTPVISVTGTYNQTTNPQGLGNGMITCSLPGATIYYTLDGSNPTTSSPLYGTDTINLSNVPAGTTIRAIAHFNDPSYIDSPIASFVYIPTGANNEPQSGVFGSVVLLDDREPHTWSYYSDGDQPVHSLKPADVKITYFGAGLQTMTTTDTGDVPTVFDGDVDAEAVAVGPDASGNQFIYMKTLENANTEGTGNYPYTLIPNPFSKRPAVEGVTPTTRVVYLTTTGNRAGRGTLTVNYTNATGQNATETVNINSNNFNNTRSITTRVGTSITYTLTRTAGTVNSYGNYDASEANGGTRIWYATTNNNTQSNSYTIAAPAAEKDYRGFYAWRVKRLSGVTITGYGVGDIIPAETEIEFVTTNAEGNEVDFEALWAQAYVVTSNTATGLHAGVSYERNFIVGAAPNAALTVPVTYSSYNPDGTGGANTVNIGTFTCAADTKFEYMNLNGGTLTANNHDLIMGRGLTGTAAMIQGINGNANNGLDYMLRVESGTYTELSFVRSSGATVSGRYLVKSILGCDYDRATDNNGNLTVSNNTRLFFSQSVTFGGSENKDQKTFDLVVKGGQYQRNIWNGNNGANNTGAYDRSFYCGQNQAGNTYPGMRYVTVEGGEFASMNGGRGVGGTSTTYASPDVVTFDLRIKNGTFHGSVFGAAADNPSIGSRRMVITGGEILGWVAAGANGTGSVGSSHAGTDGNSYVYVGGNSIVGSTNPPTINETEGGNVFGAGRGRANQKGSMVNSNVVVADSTVIFQNVYGGGFNGYIENTSNVYVLGGTVKQNVFGGGYNHSGDYNNVPKNIPISNVFVKDGKVQGSVYGGSNTSGTVVNSHVTMTGGETTNVYGGGLGTGTNIGENTVVAYSGGIINNVYGGGALGTVSGNTDVTVSGGTVNNVFGAGMGRAAAQGVTAVTANIGGTTKVTISGGTVAESVYGGGQNGNVKQANNPYNSKGRTTEGTRDINPVSTVNITGGNITNNVFGGGSMGFTNGGTVVNMSGGSVEGSVFGGAFGSHGKVYVAGQRTVNMRGGTVNRNVYGGSRNADDALVFIDDDENSSTFSNDNTLTTASVVNMSGGYVHYQVFASGYFGNVFGSTYAFIGTNAILNAPNHVAPYGNYNAEYYNAHQALRIGGSVWAGGDFGNYDGSRFGDPTVSGRSDVYIDGTGYDTESNNTTNTNYMYIGGSVYGCGTSCDAGRQGRHIIVREYGKTINASQPTAELPYSSATRALYSIQRADSLTIDNAHVVLLGEGKINSLVTTERYTIHEFRLVRLANGCSIFLNYPADQIMKFGSYTCPGVYDNNGAVSYTKVNHNGLGESGGSSDNKIRVNDGAYINVYHDQLKYTVNGQNMTGGYGELEGFSHMMMDNTNNTCAYARPKQSTDPGNIIPGEFDNPYDGGFISYSSALNTYDLAGGTVMGGSSIQIPYENHTSGLRNGEQYFRIWRTGGVYSYREGVFVAQGSNNPGYSTTDVVISLPAFENCDEGTGYYRIKSLDGNTLIDYGTDVMTVNAACYAETDSDDWMYIDGTSDTANFVTEQSQEALSDLHYIAENPNVNFGLVAIPEEGLAGNDLMLICETSDAKISAMQWANTNNEQMPRVRFRLTYYNNLTNNVVWDPMLITFEQISCTGDLIASVDVALTVTTLTSIEQEFVTQAYAVVRGTGTATDSYIAKVVLPQYVMHVNEIGEISKWTCRDVEWIANPAYNDTTGTVISNPYSGAFVGGTNYLNPTPSVCNNLFGMNMVAGLNFDNSTGWEVWEVNQREVYGWNDNTYVFGETTARDPIAFDFTLLYDGRQRTEGNYMLGTLQFTMHFTNYQAAGQEPFEKDLIIKIEVWFLGQGNNYYIDGVHGNNLYSGKYPNAAKKTLSGIFNRTDYHAGDYIFVVDTVTANTNNKLTWNGKAYSEVSIYRYPGGHQCVQNVPHAESHYAEYDLDSNACYLGPLVRVAKNMDMTGIILNGFYHESMKPVGTAAGDLQGYYHTYVPAQAPLVEVLNGGKLSVYGTSRMEYNYNSTTDGGGIYVYDGGVFNLYDGSAVDTNYVSNSKNGGGVYVSNTSLVQLSDEVYVTGNKKGIADGSIENNVYLSTYDSYVTVGSVDTDDPYTMLLADSRVGITKNNDWGNYWYAPVAYSDGGLNYLNDLVTENAPATGPIMWDDETKYEILSLNNTHLNPPTDFVYFVGTWVTEVTENPQDPAHPNNFDLTQIDTPYELAWLISYVNGLNGASVHSNAEAWLTGDIDMNANIWVPITNYTGTFHGNGHVVTGLRSPLNSENMGMFGVTNGATISDVVAQANFSGGTIKNLGTLIGTMNGGTLSNVEAAGILTGTNSTTNMGGLVGEAQSGTIHSGFAVNTMTGGNSTNVGGLVGTNGADLYNSYANVTMSENNLATTLGGLVGINKPNRTVENCYVINPIGPAFAYTNSGYINYCYAADSISTFVGADSNAPVGHGTYDGVLGRKELGYMYFDNKVEKVVESDANAFITPEDTIYYAGGRIKKWRGLLSTLNQWVDSMNVDNSPLQTLRPFTKWFRSTSSYLDNDSVVQAYINGDLPVLAFPKDNCMGTFNSDGKFLRYGSKENGFNGIDNLLTYYNTNPDEVLEPASSIFHYGDAVEVAKVPGDNVKVFIQEDAVLKQVTTNAQPFGNTTVGITFDNSCRDARDYWGNKLYYDWHFMSSSLSNAPLGTEYYDTITGYGGPVNIKSMVDNYLPNGLPMDAGYDDDNNSDSVKWDLYSYFEPQYHWMNLKRSTNDHWHVDGNHDSIPASQYVNETIFVPGKGYLMAISQDSYLSSTGVLNNNNNTDGGVKIYLTNQEPDSIKYNKGWNLVGNPYQAYLDLSKVGGGTFYIYDADQKFYAPVKDGSSDNPCIPSKFIHPHQAFFMYSATDSLPFVFKPSMVGTERSTSNSYYRDGQVNYPLVNLFVENERGNRDLTVIELHRPELDGATKVRGIRNGNFMVAASLDGREYGILFTPEGTEKVPVHFQTEEDGVYTMFWSMYNGDFTSLRLVDNKTGVNYDMLANDHYTFEASADDYSSRFYITYTCVGIEEEINDADDSFAYFDGSEWVINGKGQLDVIDMTGRVLSEMRLNNEQNRVNLEGFAKGVYLLRMIDNKIVRIQKIIVR